VGRVPRARKGVKTPFSREPRVSAAAAVARGSPPNSGFAFQLTNHSILMTPHDHSSTSKLWEASARGRLGVAIGPTAGYSARLPMFLVECVEACGGTNVAAQPGDSQGVPMLSKPFLSQVLANDALTRGLGDPEARVLVEWLVEHVERLVSGADTEALARAEVQRLYRRARAIGRFVDLWCHVHARGAAGQLAAAERFTWPLPEAATDPCELMQNILDWETRQM
jgi:hypothetical protein